VSPAAVLWGISLAAAGDVSSDFPFRVQLGLQAHVAGPVVPIEIELDRPDGSSIDVLVSTSRSLPRWTWRDAGRSKAGRATLCAPAGARALLVVRRKGEKGYELDGPFAWPELRGRRRSRPAPFRALRGRDPIVGGADELRIEGRPAAPDALCETDGVSEWQCVAVPAAFTGKVAVCRDGRPAAAGDAAPAPAEVTRLGRVAFAALINVEHSDQVEGGETPPVSLRVVKPGPSGGLVLLPDPAWELMPLGDERFWLQGAGVPGNRVLEARSPGFATRQVPLADLPPPCGLAAPILLPRATPLRGVVSDPDGNPLAGATVLVRSEQGDREKRIFGDAETDRSGRFELPDLEERTYRLRVCHGSFGCGEESGAPGPEPVAITLRPRASFRGRVLSSSGVPEPSAAVRIVPALESYAAAADRMRYLPLEVRSGSDGRFRICPPERGDFSIEIRARESGTARRAVSVSYLSPPLTDLGDIRLPGPAEFSAQVVGCASGVLALSGPLGGETSLPSLLRFPLDAEGRAAVRLPDAGAWTAWAACGGVSERVEPALLPNVGDLTGMEVRFVRGGRLDGTAPESP